MVDLSDGVYFGSMLTTCIWRDEACLQFSFIWEEVSGMRRLSKNKEREPEAAPIPLGLPCKIHSGDWSLGPLYFCGLSL